MGKIPEYSWNTSFTESDWFNLPSYFSCENGKNVPMMIINGKDDIIVPMKGLIYEKYGRNITTGFAPSNFSYWAYASLNEHLKDDAKPFQTPYSDFKTSVTYHNDYNGSNVTCS